MNFEMEDFEPVNDRVIDYRGFKLTYTDPHGHLFVSYPNGGRIPEALEGEWTDVNVVMKKIDWVLGTKAQASDKPAIDNNTRKVQEILKAAKAEVKATPVPKTAKEAVETAFDMAPVEKKKYEGKL